MSFTPHFSDDLPHERIRPANWQNIYVVGDVHGCRQTLENLFRTIDPGPEELVVFVGDLVRKGPDSEGVVDLVRSRDNFLSVQGNNEAKLLRGEKELPGLDEADLEWIASLPVAITWGDSLVVHGGVHPDRPVEAHDAESMLTMRSPNGDGYEGPFWFDEHEGLPRVFFGHTVLESPIKRDSAIGLDTGCVYGGRLTAYDVGRETFVSVPATETHQERPAEKFVSSVLSVA